MLKWFAMPMMTDSCNQYDSRMKHCVIIWILFSIVNLSLNTQADSSLVTWKRATSCSSFPPRLQNNDKNWKWKSEQWKHVRHKQTSPTKLCKVCEQHPECSMQYLVEGAASYDPDLVSLVCQLRVDQPESRVEVCGQVVRSCRGHSGGELAPISGHCWERAITDAQ